MHKFLPLLIFLAIAAVLAFLFYTPFKRTIVYRVQNQLLAGRIKITGDPTTSCVDTNTLSDATGAFDDSAQLAFYDGEEVDYPKNSLSAINDNEEGSSVLGAVDSNGKEKWIEVSLDQQKLRAWEGNDIVKEFPISSGKWAPTPTGTYEIYWKLRYVRMVGGSKDIGTFYDLPNVPDTMFFYQGYGIHGAYWHNNFGHPMSHGCINEPLADAHWLFEWAGPHINADQSSVRSTADNPGSRVFIH